MHKELLRTAGVFVFLQSATEMKREKTIKHPEDRGQEEGRRVGGGGGDLLFSHSGTVNRWIGTGW